MAQPRRKVQFHECEEDLAVVVCVIPSLEDFTEEDHENLWFSKADYHMCRAEAKVISRECVRMGYSKNLDNTYTEKSTVAQEQLQIWVEESFTGRGLERWANKDHGELRQTDQLEAVMTVLEAQDEMLAYSRGSGTVDPEKLRKVSTKATKTARHFARMMGKADSHVMATELGLHLPSTSAAVKAATPSKSHRHRSSCGGSVADSETVSTAATTRTGSLVGDGSSKVFHQSPKKSLTKAAIEEEDEAGSVLDGINDSRHLGKSMTSRLRRFGFGKNQSTRLKSDDTRISR
jgi:hypothetical protein